MKKIRFFLKKDGTSMAAGGVIKDDFEYDYDESMTVSALADLCEKIYTDIKTVMAENSHIKTFTVSFNYLVTTDDIYMCHFVTGWLNGTDEGESGAMRAVVLIERLHTS